MAEREDGFTLIELLVVVVVIGILAAIAVPTFFRQREKGWRSQAVNDMKNAATAVESYATEFGGSFAGVNLADQDAVVLRDNGFRHNANVTVEVRSTATAYCIRGWHRHLPGREYVYRSDAGIVQVGAPGALPC